MKRRRSGRRAQCWGSHGRGGSIWRPLSPLSEGEHGRFGRRRRSLMCFEHTHTGQAGFATKVTTRSLIFVGVPYYMQHIRHGLWERFRRRRKYAPRGLGKRCVEHEPKAERCIEAVVSRGRNGLTLFLIGHRPVPHISIPSGCLVQGVERVVRTLHRVRIRVWNVVNSDPIPNICPANLPCTATEERRGREGFASLKYDTSSVWINSALKVCCTLIVRYIGTPTRRNLRRYERIRSRCRRRG